ncbi:polar amino acid transport system permease protein [Psychromicrobium silvestre]|uniref:Polar amino acid transport system permease protein n=1 Tax=Psychromicrobium silvestre TaxID=1645614 RepID=A0A7Y9LRC2_9MICC|nr:GNAT family N-acetyltransferase [Psychromicrobium silvestre]NYE94170.1 polar amino acid transport system permease protein [Psychromicrobium silvestre]
MAATALERIIPATQAEIVVRRLEQDDPLAQPLLAELAMEYSNRYGQPRREVHRELLDYPATEFAAPDGVLLVLLENGKPVAGGAFRRYDTRTAELKRIWTHSAYRRRGLGRRVLEELETEALRRGYHGIYLTTGPRQPEAKALYLAAGYRAEFDLEADPENIGPLPFRKELRP